MDGGSGGSPSTGGETDASQPTNGSGGSQSTTAADASQPTNGSGGSQPTNGSGGAYAGGSAQTSPDGAVDADVGQPEGSTAADAGRVPTDSGGDAGGAMCTEAILYLPFVEGHGTATADVANGHVGTLTGSTVWSSGKLGSGVAPDGSNYVFVADATDLAPGMGDFAIAAWANIPTTAGKQARIITHGTHGQPGHDGYALMEWCAWGAVPCGGVGLLIGSDAKSAEWLVGTCAAMNDGQWHHYVGVVNRAGTVNFYVDGAKLAAPCTGLSGQAAWGQAGPGDISPLLNVSLDPTCALCIGASCQNGGVCGTPSEFFTGSVDEVAFWKRALTASEVASAYGAGAGRAVCPVAGSATCTLATAYLPFAEGHGTATGDLANDHVGTLTSGTVWSSGKLGSGVTPDGSNYVSVADATDLDPGLGDFSIAAWANVPATAGKQARIITHGTHGQPGHDGYALMEWCAWGNVPCGGVGLLIGSDAKSAEWLVGTCAAMNDGQWHHYAGVVNRAGTVDFYVDGAKLAAPCTGLSGQAAWGQAGAGDISPLLNVPLDPTCALCIGASCQNGGVCGTPSEFFTGSVDEVAFWKRALTASDIATAYGAGAGRAICP